MIKKNLELSFEAVLQLSTPSSYTVKLEGHYLNERIFEISKGEREFTFNSSSPIPKGIQTHKEIQFDSNSLVELYKDKQALYAEGKNIILYHISYDEEFKEKIFSGTITSIATSRDLNSFNTKFHRMIIPMSPKVKFDINQFQRMTFETKNRRPFYIPLIVDKENYHLYKYKFGENDYLLIDSIQKSDVKIFQKKAFNILLGLGFIKGDLIHDECFILSFDQEQMEVPENILYFAMRASVKTGQPTFTSNPFSVHSDIEFETDEKGDISKAQLDKLNEGMIFFPHEVFSNLATLFYLHEKLQRAALLYIQGHVSSLEMRIPNYFVAVEAITGYINKEVASEKKNLSPIKDNDLANEIIQFIKAHVEDVKNKKSLSNEEFNLEIITKNINKLNAPPNADKLGESFTLIGYELSPEQKKLLNERNTYLHGSFLKFIDDDSAFRDALHVSLRLHFMIAVLLYRLSGYSGKIINYAELWSHMTGKKFGEERLVKI